MYKNTMQEKLTELHFKGDIGMYYCGKRYETSNHTYGPEIRTHYLFVLVDKGSAVLYDNNKTLFGEHDLLIMFPNEKVHYEALEPWTISWLGLYGEAIDKFIKILGATPENPIIHVSMYNELHSIIEKIYTLSNELSLSSKISITALIYEFFSVLVQNSDNIKRNDPTKSALKIIDYNYSSQISIEQIAQSLTLNTSYFSRLFTEQVGMSPKQYILNKRIERAKELLELTDASIGEVATSVGYEDQLYFSRIFKKHVGISPNEYKKSKSMDKIIL